MYNFDMHELILVIFGRNVSKKVSKTKGALFCTFAKLMLLHYLAKQETRELRFFIQAVFVILPTNT